MFKKIFALLHIIWENWLTCGLGANENAPPLKFQSHNGYITSDSLKRIEQDHATTYFVKEFIILGRGLTYVWWSVHGVMDYRLYKITYHTGDTIYFHGNQKVFYVVDSNGKQWW